MYNGMNVDELLTTHIERINSIRKDMCCDCNDNDPAAIGSEEMEALAGMASSLILHLETAITLQNLVAALNRCPECGCDLRTYRRPAVKAHRHAE